jgi:hypothetical protein
MFIARRHFDTRMSGVTYQVVDIFTGRSIFATRRPEVALRIAARCNSGDPRVFASDFSPEG